MLNAYQPCYCRGRICIELGPWHFGIFAIFSSQIQVKTKQVLYELGAPGTVVQVLTLLCVILYYYFSPSLSLRLLLVSIAIDAIDLDNRMVFLLIPSYVLLAFGKANLT